MRPLTQHFPSFTKPAQSIPDLKEYDDEAHPCLIFYSPNIRWSIRKTAISRFPGNRGERNKAIALPAWPNRAEHPDSKQHSFTIGGMLPRIQLFRPFRPPTSPDHSCVEREGEREMKRESGKKKKNIRTDLKMMMRRIKRTKQHPVWPNIAFWRIRQTYHRKDDSTMFCEKKTITCPAIIGSLFSNRSIHFLRHQPQLPHLHRFSWLIFGLFTWQSSIDCLSFAFAWTKLSHQIVEILNSAVR